MDITKMTTVELKALAYDELTKLEAAQQNLRIINAEIAKKTKEEEKQENNPEESVKE